MFSKFIHKFHFLFLLSGSCVAVILMGCDARVGEAPPPNEAYEFSGAQCLSSATPVVKDFLKGTAKDQDVHAFWNCLGSAVTQFQKNVRGRTADRYTSQEISDFLEQNFLDKNKKSKISPELQAEFMKIKQLLIGGERGYITRKELEKASETFNILRDVTVGLNPYMKVLAMNWSAIRASSVQADMSFFEQANQAIQKAARDLADLFEKNGQTYALSDFVSLCKELSKFFGEDWEFSKSIERYMPVIQKVKKALAGGNENIVAPKEWRRFALLGSRGYIQYLRYYYFIESANEDSAGYRLAYVSRTLEDLLSVFEDLTAQKPEGIVSREEVTELLGTLSRIWPDFKISNGLVSEGMKIKQLIFGGSRDAFTQRDFNTARLKVSRLKSLVEKFMPYWPIYGKEWDKGLYTSEDAQKFFMEAQFTLESAGRELGILVDGSYDLRDLSNLLHEYEVLYPPANPASSLASTIDKYLPLLIDGKTTIVKGQGSVISKEDWSVVLGFGARFYTDVLYYNYFLKGEDFSKPEPVGHLSVLVNQTLNIAKDLLQAKDGHKISRNELSVLAKDLIDLKMLPTGIDQKAADQLIKVVLNNVLVEPKQRIAGVAPNALNFDSIEVLRHELQVWLDTEYLIVKTSEKWVPEEGFPAKDLLLFISQTQKNETSSKWLIEGLNELALSVNSPVPLTVDGEGRFIISNKSEQLYTQKSLRQLNLDRALSRLAIRSFVNNLDRINSYAGATQQEVRDAFVELKVVFVQMGLLSEKNNTFGDSRFRDANLFTPHSNGDSLASYQEITDLVAMIWSGIGINSNLKSELLKDCLGNIENPKDETAVKFDCARKSYKKSMAKYMLATPEYLKYMRISDAEGEFNTYLLNIFKAAGYVPNADKTAKWGDLSLAPQVVQYVEMLFARYDKNKDGVISTPEALRAFSLFKGLLLEFSKDQIKGGSITEDDLPAVFCFMLHYGKPPETLKEKILFLFKWKGRSPDSWDVDADRGALAQVLGYVADQAAKVPSAEIPNIDKELEPVAVDAKDVKAH